MLRAMIVDDEMLSVKRLKKILAESGEFETCHAFLNPVEAYEFVKTNPIHVAFVDLFMPEMNGFRLSSLLHDLDASIEVLLVTANDDDAIQAFEMGAVDYFIKPVTAQRMSKTLDKIRRRHRRVSVEPSMEAHRRSPITTEEGLARNERLTEQGIKVLQLIAVGLSNKEIADRLGIGDETVKYHIKIMYKRLKVHNRVQAMQRAKELKILV
jgi:two-component system, LytTR family, response regulator